jgi:hypothetical protein
MRSVFRLLVSGFLVGLFVVAVCGQASQTGGLTGVVTDKAGAVVAGATVEIISEATGRSVRTMTTGDDGGFSVALLPPAMYRLEVSAANFKKAAVSGVQIKIGEATRQDVTLEAGRIEEVVNVEANRYLSKLPAVFGYRRHQRYCFRWRRGNWPAYLSSRVRSG